MKQKKCLERALPRRTGVRLLFSSLFVTTLLLALSGWAAAQADPPGRVARVGHIEGSVSFQPAGQQDWVEANHNRPLTTGDNLWADQSSRAELHIGSTALRISSQTSISFLNLDDKVAQIQLAQGSLNIRVRRMDPDQAYEVDTPNFTFSILGPGEYRFDVDSTGQANDVIVRTGNGEATGGGNGYNLVAGQEGTFNGPPNQVNYYLQGAPGPDDFDQFCSMRDEREDRSASARWVSRDVIGYDDLDDNGYWRPDPTYGQVWVPNGVPYGWAPYHYGHWAFVEPWGWTWVDDAPWGFAPFHYGRWIFAGGGWAWVPGPVAVVPVYAPALVGFVGGGWGMSLSVGGGVGVAWFPLAPQDVFVPAYHVSAAYVTNINVSNTTVINRTTVVNVYNNYTVNHVTNITYVNQSQPGAVMAVSRDTFVNARPVAAAAVKISPQEIQHPQVVRNAPPLAPTPAARVGPNPPAKPSARPPAALATHPVVTKLPPSPHAAPVGRPAPIRAAAVVKHAAAPTPPPRPAQPAAGRPGAPPPAPAKPAQPAPGRPAPPPPARPAQPAAPKPAEPARPAQPAAPPPHPQAEKPAPPPPKPAPKPEEKPAAPPQQHAQPAPPAHPQAERPAPPPPKPAPKPEPKPAPPAAERPAPHPPAPAAKPAPPPPKREPTPEEKKKEEEEKKPPQ